MSRFDRNDAATMPSASAQAEPEPEAIGRRDFLRQIAAGAGAAALTLLHAEPATAAPVTGPIVGRYLVNHNFSLHYMGIETQNGNTFSGRFDDGTRVAGVIIGPNWVMSRTLPDGSVEYYSGAASVRPAPNGRDILIAGTYHRPDSDPLPWFATGNTRG